MHVVNNYILKSGSLMLDMDISESKLDESDEIVIVLVAAVVMMVASTEAVVTMVPGSSVTNSKGTLTLFSRGTCFIRAVACDDFSGGVSRRSLSDTTREFCQHCTVYGATMWCNSYYASSLFLFLISLLLAHSLLTSLLLHGV